MTIITSSEYPSDPRNRQNIIIISEEDLEKASQSYESGKFLLDDNICYLVEPRPEDILGNKFLEKIYDSNSLKSGTVLLNNVWNSDSYQTYEVALKNTVQNQLYKFIELCQLMGAKKVELNYSETSNEDINTSFNTDTNARSLKAEAGFANNSVKKIINSMQHEANFKGSSEPDFIKARSIMDSNVFSGNDYIESFYNLASNTDNRAEKIKVTVRLAEDISKRLEVIANINSPYLKKTLTEATLNRVKDASKISELNYIVTF